MGKNVLKPRAPEIWPDGAERGYNTIGDQWPMILPQTREQIEPDRTSEVRGIEINEVVATAAGKEADGSVCQIAVRIEQG